MAVVVPAILVMAVAAESRYRHPTDERNSREKHRLWTSRAYRETQTLNPEKSDVKPLKIKQNPPENQRNTVTLENPRVFLSLDLACIYVVLVSGGLILVFPGVGVHVCGNPRASQEPNGWEPRGTPLPISACPDLAMGAYGDVRTRGQTLAKVTYFGESIF